MIDNQSVVVLHNLIRRESRSFLQYLGDSLPWPTLEGAEVEAKLRPLIEQEREGIAEFVRYLSRNHAPLPYFGSYPATYTTANFVSLHHLVPPLIEEQRRLIAALENDVSALPFESQGVVRNLLETKRRHLQELERPSVSSSTPVAAAS